MIGEEYGIRYQNDSINTPSPEDLFKRVRVSGVVSRFAQDYVSVVIRWFERRIYLGFRI